MDKQVINAKIRATIVPEVSGRLSGTVNNVVSGNLRGEIGRTPLIPSAFIDHLVDYDNPHQTTAEQVGLGNVDNTADLDKPISKATQEELDKKANTASLRLVATTGSYNDLDDKPMINGVRLQANNTAEDLRLVPTDLRSLKTFRELSYEPTNNFRAETRLFVSNGGNGFTMTLQDVKNFGTKIVTVDDVETADTTNLDIGDYVYSKK